MDNEKQELLVESNEPEKKETQYPSIAKQRAMLFTTLLLLFISLCADTMLFPFFPKIAADKGLSNVEIGAVFSAYELARFIFSPIFGSLVRNNCLY